MIRKIIDEAFLSVTGEAFVSSAVKVEGSTLKVGGKSYNLDKYDKVYVVGAGKASVSMAKGIEALLSSYITDGIVVTKYGHAEKLSKIRVFEADHPVPDLNSIRVSHKIISMLKVTERDLVIFLLSGGASSLMEYLPRGVSLDDLTSITDSLLKSGACINEINAVRQSISLFKGGGFLSFTKPAKLLGLIVSDVIGDDLSTVGSAPTVYTDKRDYARSVIKRYNLPLLPFVSKEPHYADNFVIGSNKVLLNNISNISRKFGLESCVTGKTISGDVEDAASFFAELIKKNSGKNKLLIFGGEPTVRVKGNGKGGRNQELVLRVLNKLKDFDKKYFFASIGSDGTDGPTDAAGAYITNSKFKVNPIPFIENNNSYEFFKIHDSLIFTGPTGGNVMDVMLSC